MFKLTHQLPKKYWIAVSGGIDSMAVLNWLYKPNRKNSLLGVLHINHGTGSFANDATSLIKSYCDILKVPIEILSLDNSPPQGESKEAWWRNKRYEFFYSFIEPVIMAHTFDDCLEEYIMCTMVRGYQSTIPYNNRNCIRPFRLWKREDIEIYMTWNNYPWIEDPSNKDVKYKRNLIRHNIVPEIKKLNPGVYNIVRRLIEKR